MPKMKAQNGWGKRTYRWKRYQGRFDKYGRDRRLKKVKSELWPTTSYI